LWGVVTPNLNFTNFGDVLNSELSRDTITAIDTATDTCTLAKTGAALIFYHCEPNSPLRDNGAIEGGAAGFAVGDEVFVLKKFDSKKVYVVGHVNGIKRCLWEPWGKTLCAKHTWHYIGLGGLPDVDCPVLPYYYSDGAFFSSLDLVDGILTMCQTRQPKGWGHAFLEISNMVDLPILTDRIMKIKATTVAGALDRIFFNIRDSNDNSFSLFFHNQNENVDFYIGPGTGEEKILNLADYGVAEGQIHGFGFNISVISTTTNSIAIDYIDFK